MTQPSEKFIARVIAMTLCTAVLAACTGTPIGVEREQRAAAARVGHVYRPGGARPALPALTDQSTLADLLRFAMLNSPQVEAGYYQWVADVERITSARSLPDPRLTFEADITDMLEAVMPGLMMDLPGPGKLRAAGEVAAQQAAVGYHAFAAEVLRTAMAVKTAYYRLHFLEQTLRIQHEMLALLRDLEQLAQAQNAVGRVTLQDVLRAQIDREQLATQIANLEDSRLVLRSELKAALGLSGTEPDPAFPSRFEPSPDPPPPDSILASALERNPSLAGMAADVRRAQAMLELARTSGVPEFALGIESDLKASPVMWRPSASVTLPIWRDKIAAEIAAAQAGKHSAQARLTAQQIALATELASMLYLYRQSTRDTTLLVDRLIPMARQSLDVARSGYTTGRTSFLDLIDAQRQLLAFELALIDARTQRELTLAALSLSIEGVPPADAPLLDAAAASPLTPTSDRETRP
jgi:outer membrane protein TolC